MKEREKEIPDSVNIIHIGISKLENYARLARIVVEIIRGLNGPAKSPF